MSAHTQGRMTWKRRPDGSLFYVIGDHKTGPHAQGDIYICEADLSRLAACWNACKGVPTEVLEAQQSGGLPWNVADQIDKLADLAKAEAQRDELLEALRFIANVTECGVTANDCQIHDRASAAIAKATGEQP